MSTGMSSSISPPTCIGSARTHRSKTKARTKVFRFNAPTSDRFLFGQLCLGHCETMLPNIIKNCNAWFDSDDSNDYLNLQWSGETFKITLASDADLLRGAFLCNKFNFAFVYVNDHGLLHTQLHFKTLPIEWGDIRFKKIFNKLLNMFAPVSCIEEVMNLTDDEVVHSDTIENIYAQIRAMQERLGFMASPEPLVGTWKTCLKPTLRSYQENSVKWMIEAEAVMGSSILIPHPCFRQYRMANMDIYASVQIGAVYTEAPVVRSTQAGAVLADEMGLGKTIEALVLIISQMNQDRLNALATGHKPNITIQRKRTQQQIAVEEALQFPESTMSRARAYYDSCLVSVYDKREVVVPDVSCICGSLHAQDVCTCELCGIKQHFRCVGYEDTYGIFYCSTCWSQLPVVESEGTLIVCPPALIRQWLDEISNHIDCKLEVLQYDGAQISVPVYPTKLASYDIVITSYSVLQTEVHYMSQKDKFLRGRRKYSSPGSAITRVGWRRLCLDEAQMVDSVTSHISQMAGIITARYRWAITGTPMSIGLQDMFGILHYLDNSPLNDPVIFRHLADRYKNNNDDTIIQMLARTMWRTCKQSVLSEIQLPSNIVQYHAVEFTSVERFFYNCEAKETRTHFGRLSLNLDTPLTELTKQKLRVALMPFDALRRVCVHFTTAKGRYMLAQKPVQTHDQLLLALIKRNFSDCEERVRSIIASHNGLAGIYLLLGKYIRAVREYTAISAMEVSLKNTYGSQLTVDKLPLVHMCYNLQKVLRCANGELLKQLADQNIKIPSLAELNSKQEQLEEEYVSKYEQRSRKALDALNETTHKLHAMRNEFKQKYEETWCSKLLTQASKSSQFQKKSQDICDQYPKDLQIVTNANFDRIVALWLESVKISRLQTLTELISLHSVAENGCVILQQHIVEFVGPCHLRPQPNQMKSMRNECPFCLSQAHIADYSKALYHSYCENVDKQFSKSIKPEELILRTALMIKYKSPGMAHFVNAGKEFLAILELFKKEWREMNAVWLAFHELASAKDELILCKFRMRLKLNDLEADRQTADAVVKSAIMNEISASELDVCYHSLNMDLQENKRRLEKMLGTNKYLHSLHARNAAGGTPDPCPICGNLLDRMYHVLLCGHTLCFPCLQALISQTEDDNPETRHVNLAVRNIKCPVCRNVQALPDINCVNRIVTQQNEIELQGNCSSKVASILRLVLRLRSEDPDIKILIYSSWEAVLHIISENCQANDIECRLGQLQKCLKDFQAPDKGVTVLLLPLKFKTSGLNIIAATHIIFADFPLDPAEELQAIGRIHRLGQNKQTYTHKFYVKETIEDALREYAIANGREGLEKTQLTLGHIKNLLFINGQE